MKIGCQHNLGRVILYQPYNRVEEGDIIIFRCRKGCADININIIRKEKEINKNKSHRKGDKYDR